MELKWIKLATGIFDNRKIKQIELLPEGDTILIIWIKLLSLAGTINNNGLIYVTKDIPFTEDMLAGELRRPINTVRMALQTFQKFGMITIMDDYTIQITGWAKHQGGSVAIETAAEKNRLRQQRYRDKQKMLNAGQETAAGDSFSNDSNVTRNVTDNCNDNVTDNVSNAPKNKNKNKNENKIERDISYTVDVNSQGEESFSTFDDDDVAAVELFQNGIRPLKNVFEAERIRAMVKEYGLDVFRNALEIVKKKRPRAPFPYLEEVLKNRDGPAGNDPVAGAAAANKILESGEIIDFNSE